MKHNVMLTIASLLSIVLMTFHFTDDVLREGGMAVRGAWNLIAVLILLVWLYGTLVLAERRSGYIIMLIGSLLGAGMPVLHMILARTVVTNEVARTRGGYFFVWTLLALGVTGLFSFILSARGLRSRPSGARQQCPATMRLGAPWTRAGLDWRVGVLGGGTPEDRSGLARRGACLPLPCAVWGPPVGRWPESNGGGGGFSQSRRGGIPPMILSHPN